MQVAIDNREQRHPQTNRSTPLWTFQGRLDICKRTLEVLYDLRWTSLKYQKCQQLQHLKNIMPIPDHIEVDTYLRQVKEDCVEETFGNDLFDEMDVSSNGNLIFLLLGISQYKYRVDFPFKKVQELKTKLRNQILSIREAVVLKTMGIDVLHERFVNCFVFDAKDILTRIFELTLNNILDFLIVVSPLQINDFSLLYKFVPKNLGQVGNEAYTPNEIISTWLNTFGFFDLDLASNVVSNSLILARYWSENDPFFPNCTAVDLGGNSRRCIYTSKGIPEWSSTPKKRHP
jgi:hypothetical protein